MSLLVAIPLILMTAVVQAAPPTTPRPAPPTRTPATRPTPRDVRVETPAPTPNPATDSLAGLAARVKLKATPGVPVMVELNATSVAASDVRWKDWPDPLGIRSMHAYQRGRMIGAWFSLGGSTEDEVAAPGTMTQEIWTQGRLIFKRQLFITPDLFSQISVSSLLGADQVHFGILLRDQPFDEFTEPPGRVVNVQIKFRTVHGTTFEAGDTVDVSE